MYLATQRAKDLGKQCEGWKSSSTVKVGQQMKDWLYISYSTNSHAQGNDFPPR